MRPDQLPAHFVNLMGGLRCYKNIEFASGGSNANDVREHKDRVECAFEDAQVVSSEVRGSYSLGGDEHIVALDIDHEAWLIPSTNPGHSHLYVAVTCQWNKYVKFLEAAADIGLVEPGYVAASKRRGATYLRVPWLQKGGEKFASIKDVESFLTDAPEPDPEPAAPEPESGRTLLQRLIGR